MQNFMEYQPLPCKYGKQDFQSPYSHDRSLSHVFLGLCLMPLDAAEYGYGLGPRWYAIKFLRQNIR